LSRFPNEDEIEVMISDQLNTKVADVRVRFNGNTIYVELPAPVVEQLDGKQKYEIKLVSIGGREQEIESALRKIFEGKVGIEYHT
jgi:hypothetical protein